MSWWERELPSAEEMKEGLLNLERQNNKDFIGGLKNMRVISLSYNWRTEYFRRGKKRDCPDFDSLSFYITL